jgi:hypothetical protein
VQDWQPADIVTAEAMNEIGDNLAWLLTREARDAVAFSAASTSSASWATRATLTLTTRGGALLLGFSSSAYHTSAGRGYLDVAIDATRLALNGSDGSLEITPGGSGSAQTLSGTLLIPTVSAGAHTVTLEWKTDSADFHMLGGQFWALEV